MLNNFNLKHIVRNFLTNVKSFVRNIMTYQNKIKIWTEKEGNSQKKLADLLGENKQFVNYHLNKPNDMTLDVYERMRKVLNLADDIETPNNPTPKDFTEEELTELLIKSYRQEAELKELKKQIIKLKKDCMHKKDCLLKNIKVENGEVV